MFSPEYTLAAWRDRWGARARRLAEKWGWPQAWLQEFQTYLAEPRMTPEEFWVRYTLLRMDAQPRLDHPLTEAEAMAFYTGHDYMLWRNLVHRRHTAWRRVLVTMPTVFGAMLEIGCGIAPVSAWVATRRPEWIYGLVDLDCPHRAYGLWRLEQRVGKASCWASTVVPPVPEKFDVVTALDVFEHLADPLAVARQAVRCVRPQGYLHTNFVSNPLRNDLDLATEAQRDETLAYLHATLTLVWEETGYCVWRKTRPDVVERRDG